MKKLLLIVLSLLLVFSFSGCNKQATTPNVPDPVEEEDSTSTSTDEPTTPVSEPEKKPVITHEPELDGAFFVMIDNHQNARPQHGLDKADIAFEFVCETGITRFMAGFYTKDPGTVGPVRSARYYFVDMVKAYGAPYGHIGGNMDAMESIEDLDVNDLCGITNAGGCFDTNPERYKNDPNRKSPHKTYTDSDLMLRHARSKGYKLVALPELPTGELSSGQSASEVKISYSIRNPKNIVEWVYQPEESRYWRFINGSPHRTYDAHDIYANNVIIIEAPVETITVPVDGVESEIDVIGSGRALFLRNGEVFNGHWKKESASKHFEYTLSDGSEYLYEAGNVWIQQVHSLDENVTITE